MYDYKEQVLDDVRTYFEENKSSYEGLDKDQLQEQLNDDCFISDSVTGNASGSYFCNAAQADECLCGNRDLLCDALDAFGGDYKQALQSSEYCDVTIRCYLVGECVSEFVDELDDDGFFDEEEDEDEDED
jgi:hypothetical protein